MTETKPAGKMASDYMPDKDDYWCWLNMAPVDKLTSIPLGKDEFHPEIVGLHYTLTVGRGLAKAHYEFGPKQNADCFGMIFKLKDGNSKPFLLSHAPTSAMAFNILGLDQKDWTGKTISVLKAETKVKGKARNCLRLMEAK